MRDSFHKIPPNRSNDAKGTNRTMHKSSIKKYAVWARNALIEEVGNRAYAMASRKTKSSSRLK